MNINYESPGAHGPPRKGRGEKKLQLLMTVNIYQVDMKSFVEIPIH